MYLLGLTWASFSPVGKPKRPACVLRATVHPTWGPAEGEATGRVCEQMDRTKEAEMENGTLPYAYAMLPICLISHATAWSCGSLGSSAFVSAYSSMQLRIPSTVRWTREVAEDVYRILRTE